jgi:hypothetical protein
MKVHRSKETKMNRQPMHVCSDVFSVDLDDDLESGTLAFVLKDASSLVEVRLPAKGIVDSGEVRVREAAY